MLDQTIEKTENLVYRTIVARKDGLLSNITKTVTDTFLREACKYLSYEMSENGQENEHVFYIVS